MRKIIGLFVIFCFICLSGFSMDIMKSGVDERIELVCIAARMSGIEEYSDTDLKQYGEKIDTYFSKYIDHELIRFTKEIRKKNSIGYDAFISLAVHIKIGNGNILLNPELNKSYIDKRWGKDIEEYISLLDSFYKETDFSNFIKQNIELYAKTDASLKQVVDLIDAGWFSSFYGPEENYSFQIIPMLASTFGAYGSTVKSIGGEKIIYAVVSPFDVDITGLPVYIDYSGELVEIIVHEFSHSYCNPLINKYYDLMKDMAEENFELVRYDISMFAYGNPKIIMYETLVRASTFIYLFSHYEDTGEINNNIRYAKFSGFLWIEDFIEMLKVYENERNTYSSLSDFMPKIVEMVNSSDLKELNESRNCVGNLQIVNFSISDNSEIDRDTRELIVYFNEPFTGYGLSYGDGGKETYPEINEVFADRSGKKLVLTFNGLKPNSTYSISFFNDLFNDSNYCIMKESYTLNFKTK